MNNLLLAIALKKNKGKGWTGCPPVFRRFADSPAPHQNLVRAETAAKLAGVEVVHIK
jgi:hypothetical protein